jgi:hypothetical protein
MIRRDVCVKISILRRHRHTGRIRSATGANVRRSAPRVSRVKSQKYIDRRYFLALYDGGGFATKLHGMWGNRSDIPLSFNQGKEMVMLSATQEQINNWRNYAGDDSPAGPLFVSGKFAESDIVSSTNVTTLGGICSGRCGTVCSGSAGHPCC